MSHTVGTLAGMVKGDVRGDASHVITDATAIESAGEQAVTFVVDESNISRLKNCLAGALITTPKVADAVIAKISGFEPRCAFILVPDPQTAFLEILPLFRQVRGRPRRGLSERAYIDSTARLGDNCYVGPGACIGEDAQIGDGCDIHPGAVIGPGCRLGNDVVIHANAVLYHDVSVGDRSIIHSGAVIGADGFGYRFANGQFVKVPQLGTVEIHADVEIGACTTVDRGAVGPTIIGAGTKLDNLVQVAHNCEIGRHNVFAAQVGVAGSTTTGDYVRLGGQAGIKDHVRLNTGCTIAAKAAVHCDIPAGETWLGIPATPDTEQKRILIAMKRVPDMRDQLKEMQRQVAALMEQMARLQAADVGEQRRAG